MRSGALGILWASEWLRLYLEVHDSWVVTSGVLSPLMWLISIVAPLISPFITTHEPPSRT